MLTFITITPNGLGSWTFTWTATGATFYRIILEGVLVDTTPGTSYTYTGNGLNVYPKFPPPLEVVPEMTQAASELNVPFVTLQWYGEAAASHYLIQQLQDSNWVTVAVFYEGGSWFYTYQSEQLPDESEQSYRVIAVDAQDNLSMPTQYQTRIVRPPDVPKVELLYVTGTITQIIQAV